jgi:hypothetical protein
MGSSGRSLHDQIYSGQSANDCAEHAWCGVRSGRQLCLQRCKAGWAQYSRYERRALYRSAVGPQGSAIRLVEIRLGDPELLAEAKKRTLEVDLITGEAAEALAKEVVSQPTDVIARMKRLLDE